MAPKRSKSISNHLETPQKARIRGTIDYLKAKGILYKKQDVILFYGAKLNQGRYALRSSSDRRAIHDPEASDDRGRPLLLSERDLRRIERIIKDNGQDGHHQTWDSLAYEADLDVSGLTIRRAMHKRGYYDFIACSKPYSNADNSRMRKAQAVGMLSQFPNPEDWHHVRFSNECHFGWGPERRPYIIRKRGYRLHPDCVFHSEIRDDQDSEEIQKRVYVQGAIRYDFKSDLIRYEVPTNTNGKMTQKVYRDEALEPVIAKWCNDKETKWTLYKDRNSSYRL